MDTFFSTLGTAFGQGVIEVGYLLTFGAASLLAIGWVLSRKWARRLMAPAYESVSFALEIIGKARGIKLSSLGDAQARVLAAALLTAGLFAGLAIAAMLLLLATFGNYR